MRTMAQMLREAKALLTRETWIRDALARNAKGHIVDPKERSATCFCMAGACTRVHIMLLRWCITKREELGLPPMDEFNDTATSVTQVHEYLDRLIVEAEKIGRPRTKRRPSRRRQTS